MRRIEMCVLVAALMMACDPGKELLASCEQAMEALPAEPPETGESMDTAPWDTASEKCRALAEADSKLAAKGKDKLDAISKRKKKIEAVLMERKKARWKDEHETKMLVLKGLRRRIQPRWGAFTDRGRPDNRCVSEGKPPYMLAYEGGTYAENEQVAFADKCVHAFRVSTSVPGGPNDNQFCCPKPPN